MRILLIRNYPSYMAVKNNTYNIQEIGLAKALVRRGYQCDVVFWTDKETEDVEVEMDKEHKVTVYYRKAISVLKNAVYIGCKRLFEEYDILQSAEYNQIGSWILSKKYRGKVVVYHGPYYCEFNRRYNLMCKFFDLFFLRTYIRNNTKFIAKSKLASDYLGSKGIKAENIEIIGVGIDVEMLSVSRLSQRAINDFMARLDSDMSDIKLLYIGQIERRRDIVFLISVLNELVKKNISVHLYIIGSGKEEYVNLVKDKILEYDLLSKITWTTSMEQRYLSDVYEKTDFFILPTEYEIFGMVLLEAMYYKNVVLTTKNGGSDTLICNEKNGFVLEKSYPLVWANKILDVAKDRERMEEIGSIAKSTIEENYLWDKLAHRFFKIYEEICVIDKM